MENNMKNILHIQINATDKNNKNYISPDLLGKFINFLETKLGKEWEIVASPGKANLYSEEFTLYNFKVEQLSKEEMLKMLE
jgi:hypothetical protein